MFNILCLIKNTTKLLSCKNKPLQNQYVKKTLHSQGECISLCFFRHLDCSSFNDSCAHGSEVSDSIPLEKSYFSKHIDPVNLCVNSFFPSWQAHILMLRITVGQPAPESERKSKQWRLYLQPCCKLNISYTYLSY